MYLTAAIAISQNGLDIKEPRGLYTSDRLEGYDIWIPGFCEKIESKEQLIEMISNLYDYHVKLAEQNE